MSRSLYDFLFDVAKEINRTTEEIYSSLENKNSTLIATNTLVISIILSLGSILIQNISNLDPVLSKNFSILISIAITLFTSSLFISILAYKTKKYEILDIYELVKKYKTSKEELAKEIITDTFASIIKANMTRHKQKGVLIDISLIFLFFGVIFTLIGTIFLIYNIHILILKM